MLKKGDSLYSIAKQYPGITVSDIKKWNGIKEENIKPDRN
jgi:membrane-bound lytic murein transglycosylase D